MFPAHSWRTRSRRAPAHIVAVASPAYLAGRVPPSTLAELAGFAGVALLAVPDGMPLLERGELVRLLPRWYADAGAISLYYPGRTLMPGKTRAFIDHVVDAFARARLAERFAGSLG